MFARLKCLLGFHQWYRPRFAEPWKCRRCGVNTWRKR